MRVLYVIWGYPRTSETYMKTELELVSRNNDVRIISNDPRDPGTEHDVTYRGHLPYEHLSETREVCEVVEEFRPDIIHTHWLNQIQFVSAIARKTGVPFTLRTHSFDTLGRVTRRRPRLGDLRRRKGKSGARWRIADVVPHIRDEHCLGVLAFPFARTLFEAAGAPSDKIHDCYPVVNYELFHDRSPNGTAIMNAGAALPKKSMDDFIRLGAMMPDREFNLYPLGHKAAELASFNDRMGRPVNIVPPVEPDDMLSEYKKHEWVVYTASKEIGTVGWPVTIAEAQAAGVGVCMQNIRPDLAEYVGEAGFLFDSIHDVIDIVSKPFPEERRELGFEHARKSDAHRNLSILTDLWAKAATPSR